MGTFYTRGFILQRQNFRESDRLVSLYSRELGKIILIARGALKITSKLAGSIEPFILADFMVARGKLFDTITSVESDDTFRLLHQDPEKVFLMSFCCQLVAKTAPEHQPDSAIFDLVCGTAKIICRTKNFPPKKIFIRWQFAWKYLAALGYKPELKRCVSCRRTDFSGKIYFSLQKGGLICVNCAEKTSPKKPISVNALKTIRFIFSEPTAVLLRLKADNIPNREIDQLTFAYLNYRLEVNWQWDNFFL